MKTKLVALLILAVSALSIGALLFGPSYSEWVMPGGLPFGNALAATGLCSLAGAAFLLSPVHSIRRRASRTTLAVSVLWLPGSIALAGNLALNFSGFRGAAWLALSSVTVIAVLGCLLWAVAGLVFDSHSKSGAA